MRLSRLLRILEDPVPWNRMPGEGLEAYRLFLAFLGLPPERRTVAALLDRVGGELPGTRAEKEARIRALMAEWRWQERAAALDFMRSQVDTDAWTVRDMERRLRVWNVASKMLDRVEEAVECLNPAEMSPRDVARLATAAADLMRSATADMVFTPEEARVILENLPQPLRDKLAQRIALIRATALPTEDERT